MGVPSGAGAGVSGREWGVGSREWGSSLALALTLQRVLGPDPVSGGTVSMAPTRCRTRTRVRARAKELRGRRHLLRAACLALIPLVTGARPLSAQSPAAQTYVLVVTGAGGDAEYAHAFHTAAQSIAEAARRRFGLPDSNVVYLGEDPARAPSQIAGKSTKANVERELARLAARARPGDEVWVVLIGHGSASGAGRQARFNLPGPDMTAADFARLLVPLGRQRLAFVNAASASGDFVRALAAPNRAIVTATKSSLERNGTIFANHFASALAGEGADVDKDGGVSLLEAFTYARREVARAYESENRLLTEHAQLDDDGDGVGSAEPAAKGGDGRLAARLVLAASRTARAVACANPRLAALHAEQRALEERLTELRSRKHTMDPDEYEKQLEALLLNLARTGQAIRAIEGVSP